MRIEVCAIATLLIAACSLVDDSYEPCSTIEGTGVPAPGPTPGTDPGPTGPQPNDASGDRYRRASNGLICRCGDYDIGCYDSPEGALKATMCRPSPLGPEYEPNCQPLGIPGNGETPPTTEASGIEYEWQCQSSGWCTVDGVEHPTSDARTIRTKTNSRSRAEAEMTILVKDECNARPRKGSERNKYVDRTLYCAFVGEIRR